MKQQQQQPPQKLAPKKPGTIIKAIGRRAFEVSKDEGNVKVSLLLERDGKYSTLAQPVLTPENARNLAIELNRIAKQIPTASIK
jgi:hypothetical protein